MKNSNIIIRYTVIVLVLLFLVLFSSFLESINLSSDMVATAYDSYNRYYNASGPAEIQYIGDKTIDMTWSKKWVVDTITLQDSKMSDVLNVHSWKVNSDYPIKNGYYSLSDEYDIATLENYIKNGGKYRLHLTGANDVDFYSDWFIAYHGTSLGKTTTNYDYGYDSYDYDSGYDSYGYYDDYGHDSYDYDSGYDSHDYDYGYDYYDPYYADYSYEDQYYDDYYDYGYDSYDYGYDYYDPYYADYSYEDQYYDDYYDYGVEDISGEVKSPSQIQEEVYLSEDDDFANNLSNNMLENGLFGKAMWNFVGMEGQKDYIYTYDQPLTVEFFYKVEQIKNSGVSELQKVKDIYNLTLRNVPNYGYSDGSTDNIISPFEETLRCGTGICRDTSVLLYSALRKVGIDANIKSGSNHMWVRVNLRSGEVFDLDPSSYRDFVKVYYGDLKPPKEDVVKEDSTSLFMKIFKSFF